MYSNELILDFDFETVTKLDSEWLNGYDIIRSRLTNLFFLLFQVFDDELKWMFPSRVEAHDQLDKLLSMIDGMVADKRTIVTEKFNSPGYASVPDAEKDFLTLMLEAEMQGEGKLSDLELRVSCTSNLWYIVKLTVSLLEKCRRFLFRWT